MVNCEFCDHEFTNRDSLKHHQRTAKYCLIKQGKSPKIYSCICNKKFNRKDRFETHQNICTHIKKDFEKQLVEKDMKIQELTILLHEKEKNLETSSSHIVDLTSKLEKIALEGVNKPTHIHNGNNNNANYISLQPLTDEHLQICAKLLTPNDVMSMDNLANFAIKNSLKDRVVPTDRNRCTLTYRSNHTGKVMKDPFGSHISNKFFKSLSKNEAIDIALNRVTDKVKDGINLDSTDFGILMDKLAEIQDIKRASNKEDNIHDDTTQKFVVLLCKLLPNYIKPVEQERKVA